MSKEKKGKFIVIDGADGSGKATQVGLLVKRLRQDGYRVETIDFPQYSSNHFGKLLRQCLDGELGEFMNVHPKIASTLYAADRFESSSEIRQWLQEGIVVIADRYVSSNMIHQGSKLKESDQRNEFLQWLDKTEHEVFGIPRPQLIIQLDVPLAVRQNLMINDKARGALDMAENDIEHQQASETAAHELVASMNNWNSILCVHDEKLRTIEDIHEEVYEVVVELLNK